MSRGLYRFILRLHPLAFRRKFAEEMLWIFDEAAAAEGTWLLLRDGFVSLARQWLRGSEYWKILAALAAAVLQVTVAGAVILAAGYSHSSSYPAAPIGMLGLIHLTVWLVAGILFTVLLTVLWFRKVSLCSNSGMSRSAIRALPPSRM